MLQRTTMASSQAERAKEGRRGGHSLHYLARDPGEDVSRRVFPGIGDLAPSTPSRSTGVTIRVHQDFSAETTRSLRARSRPDRVAAGEFPVAHLVTSAVEFRNEPAAGLLDWQDTVLGSV